MSGPGGLRRSARGFTLVEVVVSALIGAMIVGAATAVTMSGIRTQSEAAARSAGSAQVERAMSEIARQLVGASRATVTGPADQAGTWSDVITFDRVDGFDAASGEPLTQTVRISWALASGETLDGTDDDGNGMADDGEVTLVTGWGTANARSRTVLRRVPRYAPNESVNGRDDDGDGIADERGLTFELAGNEIVVRLACETAPDSSRRTTQSSETRLHMRNQ